MSALPGAAAVAATAAVATAAAVAVASEVPVSEKQLAVPEGACAYYYINETLHIRKVNTENKNDKYVHTLPTLLQSTALHLTLQAIRKVICPSVLEIQY